MPSDSAMNAPAAQGLGELGTSAMEPRLDGADRARKCPCDLVVRQILLVKQDEDQAVFGPEPLEAPFQLTGQIFRVGQSGPGVDLILERPRGRQGRSSDPPCQGRTAAIGRDFQEPGTEWSGRVKPRNRPQGAEER